MAKTYKGRFTEGLLAGPPRPSYGGLFDGPPASIPDGPEDLADGDRLERFVDLRDLWSARDLIDAQYAASPQPVPQPLIANRQDASGPHGLLGLLPGLLRWEWSGGAIPSAGDEPIAAPYAASPSFAPQPFDGGNARAWRPTPQDMFGGPLQRYSGAQSQVGPATDGPDAFVRHGLLGPLPDAPQQRWKEAAAAAIGDDLIAAQDTPAPRFAPSLLTIADGPDAPDPYGRSGPPPRDWNGGSFLTISDESSIDAPDAAPEQWRDPSTMIDGEVDFRANEMLLKGSGEGGGANIHASVGDMAIDYEFISELEGGFRPDLYHPGGNSGVTVGIGIDLGGRKPEDLRALGIQEDLINRLTPYLAPRGAASAEAVKKWPLTLSDADAWALTEAIGSNLYNEIIEQYNRDSAVDFENLPSAAQTVIASVGYQYGNPHINTPNFWRNVTTQNWDAAIAELRKFGDPNNVRRLEKQADYLEAALYPD